MNASSEEIEELEKLADVFECIAVTLYEILGAALINALEGTTICFKKANTANLREGARNVAYKLDAWDKIDTQ